MLSWRGVGRLENARVKAWGWVAWLCAWLALTPEAARAAQLAWHAPAECQRAEVATAQVEKLVGEPLAGIDWISFEVEVAIDEAGAHRVLLRTLAQGSAPREREITGVSCAEITDAVSVAIALTISERAREREQAAAAEPPAQPEPPAAGEPAAELEAPLRFAVGAGFMIEAGALPDPVPGLDLGGALEWKALRVGAFVAVFVPQDEELSGEQRGGTFDLVLAGLDVCAKPALEALHLLACAGFELGRIGARGDNVVNPRDEDAGWYAPRVELGVGYGLGELVRVWLRAGAAIPLARPEFVLDDVDTVHQPSNVSLRGQAALEIVL